MSEAEYKGYVLAEYNRRKACGDLPAELLSPSPANIKAQAVKLCDHNFDPKDERTLESFVNGREGMAAYKVALQNCNADLFRPIVNFLKDPSVNTNFKNVQLLAWLIGFDPRPYYPGLVIQRKAEKEDTKREKHKEKPKQDGTNLGNPKSEKKPYKMIAISLIVLVATSTGMLLWTKTVKKRYTGREGCMVWDHDQYEPIECSERQAGMKTYPIDHELVEHFKRITEPDTLTYYSVNKVWYANQNGRVDFYTHSGPYPLDTNFRVLPMSEHIYKKYVLHLVN